MIKRVIPIIKINNTIIIIPNIIFIDSDTPSIHLEILLSAIQSHMAEDKLNNVISTKLFIIGSNAIETITNIPITPTAFFVMLIPPITLSAASLINFPTTGTVLLTAVLASFPVIPSTFEASVPSNDINPSKNYH